MSTLMTCDKVLLVTKQNAISRSNYMSTVNVFRVNVRTIFYLSKTGQEYGRRMKKFDTENRSGVENTLLEKAFRAIL